MSGRQNRQRVYSSIAPIISDFAVVVGTQTFHVEELRRYVQTRGSQIAPDSPGRILREMRLEGVLDYTVINRRNSLYQFIINVTQNEDPEMNMTVKPSELVEEYITLRDAKSKAKETFDAFCKEHFTTRMEEIEGHLLNTLSALGVDSLAGSSGTAYRKVSTSVTIADAREFQRHVIGGENWELIDWRANKTAVNDLVEAGEAVPPGVNRSATYTIGIRRKS